MTLHAHFLSREEPACFSLLRTQLQDLPIQLETGDKTTVDTQQSTVLIAGRPGSALLAACHNLRTLIIPFAGLPPETKNALALHPHLKVYNLHHNAVAVAEMAVALLLAASKQIVPMDRALRNLDWTPRYKPDPALSLRGRTALILGYGAIGQCLAPILSAFGVEVLAVRRSCAQPYRDAQTQVFPRGDLNTLLPRANFLLLALPLTQQTHHLIDADALDRLPERAVLVNVARADIVEERALYTALTTGKLGAAALDVWYHYPPTKEARTQTAPCDTPLSTLDQVVLSPHRAGHTHDIETLRAEHLARVLRALATGQHPPGQLEVNRGY